MRIIGNLLWWLFGGLEAAIGYFTGSLALACTIIGIPFAIQTFKIGLLCLWPFGSTVRESNSPTGCIRIPLNLLWLIFGGLWACIMHLFFGFLLCITIIGIPWGKQHFKMAGLSLAPFGKDVELGFKKNKKKKSKGMNTLHSCLAYYLLGINAVTFIVYGIDKYKAKKAKWRIPEATLLLLAVLGGSIGAWMGMKVWHHKTMHKKFKYGIPAILLIQIALMAYLHMNR